MTPIDVVLTTRKVIASATVGQRAKWKVGSRFMLLIDGHNQTAMVIDMKTDRKRVVNYQKAMARL